jgi:hypothetical protein
MQAGLYAYEPNSVLIEVDWNKDRSTVDTHDRAIFMERKSHQFEGRVIAPQLLNLMS